MAFGVKSEGTGGDLGIKIDAKGMQKLIERFSPTVRHATANAINKVMYEAFEESQYLVPVATGALKLSGRFIPAQAHDKFPTGTISYGGPDVGYALFVHENLFNLHEEPTQAKFVEVPIEQRRGELMKVLKKNMAKDWGKIWL